MARPGPGARAALLLFLVAGTVVVASAAPLQLHDDTLAMNQGNITSLPWINPGGQDLSLGGNLDLGGNNITSCSYIDGVDCDELGGGVSSVADDFVDETGDSMSGFLNLTGNRLLEIGSGLTNFTSDGNLSMGGRIDMNGNRLRGLAQGTADSDAITLLQAQNSFLQRSGDSMSGDLDMAGYDLMNVDQIGNGTNAVGLSSNLDMQNNALLGYWGDPCPSGEAVQDIDNTGSFTCTSITSGVSDTYVNESGDTMSGDLDLSGNQLRNVASLTSPSGQNISVFGTVDMRGNRIRNLGSPVAGSDAL
ncbi:MAG: hypothetical protein ABEI07_00800, partial [Candidatus Nanohaloarchaea archaeon]